MGDIVQFVEKTASPSLLPILRSRQQGELLADILDDPSRELSLTDLSGRLNIPLASVHREIERAEAAGIVCSRRVGRTRLVAAAPSSPYFGALRQLLVSSFGVPERLRRALEGVVGVKEAHIFGSWAASWHGEDPGRPVGDIDLLVLGDGDRDALYRACHDVGTAVGREIQVQIRPADWLRNGSGSFHDTLLSRPMVQVLPSAGSDKKDETSSMARSAT